MEIVNRDYDMKTMAAGAFVAMGILLLFGISQFWALFILLPGLALLALFHLGGKPLAWLAVPGMIVAGTGALLLFQSLTGYWESWAFAWTLYGVFTGVGLTLMAERQGNTELRSVGRTMSMASGAAFVGLGLLFILITQAWLIVLAFLAAGGYLLLKEFGGNQQEAHTHYPAPRKRVEPVDVVQYNSDSDSVVRENIRRIKVEVQQPVD